MRPRLAPVTEAPTGVSVWDEIADPLGKTLADNLRQIVRAYENGAERSQQKHLGPSQIGNPCTRCLARACLDMAVERDFDDPWCRIIGTAVHAWLEEAAAFDNVHVVRDAARWKAELRVHPHPDLLPAGGKCDLYDAELFAAIDHKIVGAEPLRKYKLNGPGQQYRVQAHLYGLGLHRAGLRVEHVAIAFWQRGGRLSDLYVWTEPWDVAVAMDALNRYRVIREQALAIGPQILPHLPADPSCWDCGGKDVSPDELASLHHPTRPNQA